MKLVDSKILICVSLFLIGSALYTLVVPSAVPNPVESLFTVLYFVCGIGLLLGQRWAMILFTAQALLAVVSMTLFTNIPLNDGKMAIIGIILFIGYAIPVWLMWIRRDRLKTSYFGPWAI